jgi:arylsulfatase A-like enzyme
MHKNGTPQEVIEYMAVVREYWAPFNYENFCVELGRGERRSQLVQLVDVYTTALAAIGRPVPPDRHGIDLLPVLEHATARTRDYAVAGLYANSITITDGDWILHQAPVEGNKPLYWYGHWGGHRGALGPYVDGRREVNATPYPTPTWLSHKGSDPSELVNLAEKRPGKLREMQRALKTKLIDLKAPAEQLDRLGLREV